MTRRIVARLIRVGEGDEERLLNNLSDQIPLDQLVRLFQKHPTDIWLELFFHEHPHLKAAVDQVLNRE